MCRNNNNKVFGEQKYDVENTEDLTINNWRLDGQKWGGSTTEFLKQLATQILGIS